MSRPIAEHVFWREYEEPTCRAPHRRSAAGGKGWGLAPLHRDLRFSNRKFPLLEYGPTHRKQTVRPRSNRKFAIRQGSQSRATNRSRGICSQSQSRATNRSRGICSNRKLLDTPCRVIFGLTHSKQRMGATIKCHTFCESRLPVSSAGRLGGRAWEISRPHRALSGPFFIPLLTEDAVG
jgi:hypothetical protein